MDIFFLDISLLFRVRADLEDFPICKKRKKRREIEKIVRYDPERDGIHERLFLLTTT